MIDFGGVKTPCYVIDRKAITENLEILKRVKEAAGCRILLAQKAFSCYALYPLMSKYLDGTTASSLFEAKLGREEFGGETHIFSAAYRDEEFDEIASVCDHIVFNSVSELERYRGRAKGKEIGLRVNPGYSEIETALYDPCAKGSRLGVTAENFFKVCPKGLDGLHFHALCEQGADVLKRVADSFERLYSTYFKNIKWVNLGGGHHITKNGYDTDTLVSVVKRFKDKYGLEVYLEPGEAAALNAGYLVTTVLDVVENGGVYTAVTDCSAECHMPDVLEMPYRPEILGAGMPNEKKYTYRIGSQSCLAGDYVGEYSFDAPLKRGDRLTLCDMAIYSMVKNNTFNGMPLPSIYRRGADGRLSLLARFGYEDFFCRLGRR